MIKKKVRERKSKYTAEQNGFLKNWVDLKHTQENMKAIKTAYAKRFGKKNAKSGKALLMRACRIQNKYLNKAKNAKVKATRRKFTSEELSFLLPYVGKKLTAESLRKIARKFNKEFKHLGKRTINSIGSLLWKINKGKIGAFQADVSGLNLPGTEYFVRVHGKDIWTGDHRPKVLLLQDVTESEDSDKHILSVDGEDVETYENPPEYSILKKNLD